MEAPIAHDTTYIRRTTGVVQYYGLDVVSVDPLDALGFMVVGTIPEGLVPHETFAISGVYSFNPQDPAYSYLLPEETQEVVFAYRVWAGASTTTDARVTIIVTGA